MYVNSKGGLNINIPIISWYNASISGSAFIASFVGMAAYGGYLGNVGQAVVWPIFTVVMKYLSYFGVALIVIVLILIPQLQYKLDKENTS